MRLGLLAGLLLAACSTTAPTPSVEIVRLLTATAGAFSCPASLIVGELVVDPDAGTAMVEQGRRFPVRWPPGYVGRVVGNEVQVLDDRGNVVAVTGQQMELGGGLSEPGIWVTCHGLIE